MTIITAAAIVLSGVIGVILIATGLVLLWLD